MNPLEEQELVASKLSEALAAIAVEDGEEHPPVLVESYTILVKMHADGTKSMSAYSHPDQRAWTTLGLLEFCRQTYQAQLASGFTRDGE